MDFSPQEIALFKNRQQTEMARNKPAPKTAPKPKKQSGKGGFLSSLISEGGGLGGAVAGGAAGTAILPGIGTAIGAGLGGLAGAFGGRLAENKYRDNEFRPGQALTEGLVTGALSAVGPGFQAFKAAKGAKGLSSVIGGIDDVAKTSKALPSTAAIGAVEKKGLGMTSKSGGYFVGATRPGAKPLAPSKVQAYDKLLRKLKIPANDASDMLYAIEPTLNKTYGLLDDAVKGSTATIDGKKLAKNVLDDIASKKGLGEAEFKIAREQAAKFKGKMSPQEALKAKREFDDAISYVANPDAATSSKQAVSEMFRSALKKEIDNAVPGVKSMNSTAHDLSEVMSFTSRAANRTGMEATSGGGGIAGRVLSSPLANTMRAKAGVATQAVGRGLAGTGSPVTQATRYAKLQAPGNVAGALMDSTQPTDPTLEEPVQEPVMDFGGAMTSDPMSDPMSQFGGGLEQPAQSAYSLQQAMADLQANPDAKSRKNIMDYYKFIQAGEKANKPDKVAVKAQDAVAAGGQALNIIGELEQAYEQAGGGQGRVAGTIGSLSGRAGMNNEVNIYNDAKLGFLSNVARSLGEKGVITDYDIERIAKLFPSPSSNPQEAQAKWGMIRSIISGGIRKNQEAYSTQSYQNNYEPDLSSLINQYGGM